MKAAMVMYDSLNRHMLAELRLRLDARPQLHPLGRARGHFRQPLRRLHAVHTGAPGAAHRPAQLPAPFLGSARALR